jgi:hypothetical protein
VDHDTVSVAITGIGPTTKEFEMHRISTRRVVSWTGALVVVLVAATAVVAFASNQIRAAKVPAVTNGGARQWVAFDPEGRSIGPVQFLSKTISVISTSTARNSFTLYYEPAHTLICASAVGPAPVLCGVQPSVHLSGGYFQVIATQPVLVAGHSDVPVISYAQEPNGTYGADATKGTIQNIPLLWQQGCPPRVGSGCPVTALPTKTGVQKVQGTH